MTDLDQPLQHHFTGLYPDDAINRLWGQERHWVMSTDDPDAVVASYLTGLWPFESVTYVVCPEQRIGCSC